METTLDRIDIALIHALQKDGRASNKELAAVVGLAPSSTHARIRRLLASGVVRGVHAEIDPERVGVGLEALVFLRLATHAREGVGGVWGRLVAMPEVRSAFYVGGDDDVVLHVAARDTRHLRDLVLDRISQEPNVARIRTEIVFQQARKAALPIFLDIEA